MSGTATAKIPSTSGTLLHNHLSPLPALSLCGRSRCEANETETDYRYLDGRRAGSAAAPALDTAGRIECDSGSHHVHSGSVKRTATPSHRPPAAVPRSLHSFRCFAAQPCQGAARLIVVVLEIGLGVTPHSDETLVVLYGALQISNGFV
jgi:hypothetical protein